MSQELIYTSARKGLKLGSRGFCTVASTEGMAKNLADRLESLSGYRHIHSRNDPQSTINPVNCSYVKSRVGGQTFHILSRIADAGLDYTQRTNKLARHVALVQRDLVNVGPAWIMSQSGFMETQWSGEPRVLPVGRSVPQGELRPAVCNAWKRATGDAGWAGVLAETIAGDKIRDSYLIFQPGTDLLQLILEAQALLPSELRWEATFSTYFTQIPPGTDCRWRCVVKGSPEAARVRKSPETLVLDLTTKLGLAPDSDYVEVARAGRLPQAVKRDNVPLQAAVIPGNRARGGAPAGSESPLQVPSLSRPPRLDSLGVSPPAREVAPIGRFRPKRSPLPWILGVTAIVVVFSTIVVGWLIFSGTLTVNLPEQPPPSSERPQDVALDSQNDNSEPPDPIDVLPPEAGEQPKEENHGELPEENSDKPSPDRPETNGEDPPVQREPEGQAHGNSEVISAQALREALAVFRESVPLPSIPRKSALSFEEDNWTDPIQIGVLPTKLPLMELALLGIKESKDGPAPVDLVSKEGGKTWPIYITQDEIGDRGDEVARLYVEGDKLRFRWHINAKKNSNRGKSSSIRNAILSIRPSQPGEAAKFVSFQKIEEDTTPLIFDKELKLKEDIEFQLPPGQKLRYHFRIVGLDNKLDNKTVLEGTIDGRQEEVIRFGPDKCLVCRIIVSCPPNEDKLSIYGSIKVRRADGKGKESSFKQTWGNQQTNNRRTNLQEAIEVEIPIIKQKLIKQKKPKELQDLKQHVFDLYQNEKDIVILRKWEKTLRAKVPKNVLWDKYPVAIKLRKDFNRYPELTKLLRVAESIPGKIEIHVRIWREPRWPDLSSGKETPTVDVYIAGRSEIQKK